jgi:nickel-dependent lactate racemase
MILFSGGSPETCFSLEEAKAALVSALDRLGLRKRVLVVPPDCTRRHSQAGPLTEAAWEYYGKNLKAILPALGTHAPMTEGEIGAMFGKVPKDLFQVHDWRGGVTRLGEVPGELVRTVSEGRVDYPIPVEVDRLIVEGEWDLVLSIGQVVPHEVAGMAGYTKNILVGAGGPEVINKTHFLGAAYGLERIMGRAVNPVRQVLDYGAENFARALPIVHVLTVVGKGADGCLALRGLTVGDGQECYAQAAELAFKVNIEFLDAPLRKVVVYLDPAEFKSTWLGNKSIYRSRLAMADGGELIVLAPGVARFGEDADIDRLIRKYGYVGTPKILDLVKREDDLQRNLSAAAHLIHGSSEGRFTITYCPGRLTRDEVEGVGFRYGDLDAMMKRYDPGRLVDGLNRMPDGEEVFFISKPGLGLWTCRERFPEA